MNIQEKILTLSKMNRPGYANKGIQKIVVHYVGNPNTTAIANRNYFDNLRKQSQIYASSHYIVGLDGEIVRCIPENEVAYHSGNLEMNYKSIGIETCHPDSTGKFSDITNNALTELCADICKRYKLNPIIDIIRHFDVTGKNCPLYYVNNQSEWDSFKKKVNLVLNSISNELTYVVIKGDNLTKIAKKYGVTIDNLARINNIVDKNKISIGQTLKIPREDIPVTVVAKYKVIAAIGLNCRIAPRVTAPKVTAFTCGTVLTIYETQNNFGRCDKGWVCMDFIKKL